MITGAHDLDRGWEAAKMLWSLDPSLAYLNHGSYGAVPIPVQRAQQRYRDEVESDPMRFYSRGLAARLAHTRARLAAFVGADPETTALTANATTGASAVLRSVALTAGDDVVVTDHAYGAVQRAVQVACRGAGATVSTVAIPLDATDADIVAAVERQIGPRTRLVVIDHVSSSTAREMPVAAVVQVAHHRGVPVLVDAAHAPGMLDVDVSALGADFWVGNFHKWVCTARGTALLSVSPQWRDVMVAPVVSWSDDDAFPRSFEEAGTQDVTAWLSAPVALHMMSRMGWASLRQRNAALVAVGAQLIASAIGADLEGIRASERVSMRVIPLPDGIATTTEAAFSLHAAIADTLACEVAVNAWNGRGLLRVSGQAYNTVPDYERLAAGLPRILCDLRS